MASVNLKQDAQGLRGFPRGTLFGRKRRAPARSCVGVLRCVFPGRVNVGSVDLM